MKASEIREVGWYYRHDDDDFIQVEASLDVCPPDGHSTQRQPMTIAQNIGCFAVTLSVNGSTYRPDWGNELSGPVTTPGR